MGFEDNRRHLHPAYAQQSRALEFHNCSIFDRLLLGSRVVRPGLGSWAAGIWCASKSGNS